MLPVLAVMGSIVIRLLQYVVVILMKIVTDVHVGQALL